MLSRFKKYLFIILSSTYFAVGCGIFDTRDAEKPNAVRSTFVPPTSPELVITNLEFSILEKNSDNYFKCLSRDNFNYIPDSRSQLIYGHIFKEWNVLSEKRYLDNILLQTDVTSTSRIFFDNKRFTQISPDSAMFQSDYILVFQHRRNDIPKSSKGSLNIYINSDEDRLFHIVRWEDYRYNDTDFTWSQTKAVFWQN